MDPKTLAALIELAIPVWYERWGRHLKWLGPTVVVFGVAFLMRRR